MSAWRQYGGRDETCQGNRAWHGAFGAVGLADFGSRLADRYAESGAEAAERSDMEFLHLQHRHKVREYTLSTDMLLCALAPEETLEGRVRLLRSLRHHHVSGPRQNLDSGVSDGLDERRR